MLLLSGLCACSPSDAGSEGGPATPIGSPTASGTTEASGQDDGPSLGPLEDYLGVGANVGTTVSDAEDRAYEEAIARCMAAEGFEYVPYVDDVDATFLPDGTVTLDFEKSTFPDLPPDEFAARFGYGLSTEPPAAQVTRKDPNEAIVSRMSVSERVAYQEALRGKGNELDSQGYLAGNSLTSSDTSCLGRADAEALTTEQRVTAQKRVENVRDSFASLLKRVRDLRDAEMKDPRVVAATTTWSSCLAAAGHRGFTALDQPRARALDDARALIGRDRSGAATADPTRLAALRKAEVELAVADERCLRDWRATYRAVERDLEAQFVSDNVAELEDFRTAMSAAIAQQD
jgi:hypothetical protein